MVKALTDRTYVDLPESMVQRQIDEEIEGMSGELEGRGISLDDYLEAMKGTGARMVYASSSSVTSGSPP